METVSVCFWGSPPRARPGAESAFPRRLGGNRRVSERSAAPAPSPEGALVAPVRPEPPAAHHLAQAGGRGSGTRSGVSPTAGPAGGRGARLSK